MFNLRTYVLVYIWVGCLQSFVTDKDKNGPLLFDKVVDFSYQLFSALDFLHSSLRILHRDIKRTYDNACIKKIVCIVISTMHAHVHTQCIHTYTCTHIHTHVHVLACTRTCIHTYMHTHTKIHKPVTQVAYLNINIHTAMNNLYIKIFSMYDYIWDNLILLLLMLLL